MGWKFVVLHKKSLKDTNQKTLVLGPFSWSPGLTFLSLFWNLFFIIWCLFLIQTHQCVVSDYNDFSISLLNQLILASEKKHSAHKNTILGSIVSCPGFCEKSPWSKIASIHLKSVRFQGADSQSPPRLICLLSIVSKQ